ncbi:hypothetical protein B0H19DRAFT_1373995 [Mycena capillaripes]|nr:hypothetical protein B0H19DRAFT_1373995 [Mycena capillaripes]
MCGCESVASCSAPSRFPFRSILASVSTRLLASLCAYASYASRTMLPGLSWARYPISLYISFASCSPLLVPVSCFTSQYRTLPPRLVSIAIASLRLSRVACADVGVAYRRGGFFFCPPTCSTWASVSYPTRPPRRPWDPAPLTSVHLDPCPHTCRAPLPLTPPTPHLLRPTVGPYLTLYLYTTPYRTRLVVFPESHTHLSLVPLRYFPLIWAVLGLASALSRLFFACFGVRSGCIV